MASENFSKLKQLTEELVDRDFFLKKKQEMLERVLLSTPTPVLVWVIDKELRFITDAGAMPSLGVTEGKHIGQTVYDYFETNDPTFHPIDKILKSLQGDSVKYLLEINDHKLWTYCSPMRDYNEEIVGAVGVTWDFTRIYTAIRTPRSHFVRGKGFEKDI